MTHRLSYTEWQQVLAEHFFDGRHIGRGFWLFVDDEAADALGATLGVQNGASQLRDLGRAYVGSDVGGGIFTGSPHDQFRRWLAGDRTEVPPTLPVLALSVLAASHMHASENASQTNYYRRFRELLDLPPRGGMPTGFDRTVVTYWRRLDEWAQAHTAEVGKLVIPAEPQPPYVGYPISQALWRQTDSDHLGAALWDALGEQVAGAAAATLEHLACHLVVTAGVVPERARRVFTDAQFTELRMRILEDIAGTPPPPETEAAGQARATRRQVVLHGRAGPRLAPGFAVARDERWPSTLRAVADTGEEVVARTPPTVPSFYALDGIEPSDLVLREGFVLETEYGTWRFAPQELYVLAPHPELGLATTQLQRVDEAIVLAPNDRPRGAGWPRPVSDATLPGGWGRYDGVCPDDVLDAELETRLLEATGTQLELEGGLAIRPRTFLAFAPPDVVLPAELCDRPVVDVVVDEVGWQLRPWRGRVVLGELDLAEGSHTVRIGEGVTSLTITTGLAPACTYDPELAADLGEGRVMGAYLDPSPSPPSPRPIVVPSRAEEVLLVGARVGEVASPAHHAPPQWLVRTPVRTTDYEVRPGFDVVWEIERWQHRTVVRRISSLPPVEEDVAADESARWASVVRTYLGELSEEGPDAGLADRYLRVAAGVDSREGAR
jgi:hypothetical protein